MTEADSDREKGRADEGIEEGGGNGGDEGIEDDRGDGGDGAMRRWRR